ncbi:MAG: lyase family protein, partial [Polyangiales bacterium]
MSSAPTLDPGFGTPAMSAVFDLSVRYAGMLRFEAALARAQAALGIIPAAAARAIANACDDLRIDDACALAERGWKVGTPLNPLLDLLRARLAPEHAVHLHFGATTQDAVDTATALQLREGLGLLLDVLADVAARLRSLADAHRGTAHMARTLMQHAQPTSFGLTAAHWLAPLITARAQLAEARDVLPVQLGGSVGARDAFGARGDALNEALADLLALRVAPVAWHGDRTPVLRAVQAVSTLVRALTKLASDLVLLAQSDVGEVRMRGGASSSMAHKQNPFEAVRARAAGEAALGFAGSLMASTPFELQRAAGSWHLEWLLVPLVFHAASASLEATRDALAGLRVDAARMAQGVGGKG